MTNDRTYYRSLSTTELREAARYAPHNTNWQELAIALAERIEVIRDETLSDMEMRY
jgi:hypothetical protein